MDYSLLIKNSDVLDVLGFYILCATFLTSGIQGGKKSRTMRSEALSQSIRQKFLVVVRRYIYIYIYIYKALYNTG
jgi:hypothetical protein